MENAAARRQLLVVGKVNKANKSSSVIDYIVSVDHRELLCVPSPAAYACKK